jgi:recombination protein RecR
VIHSKSVEDLAARLAAFPGIGPKTALRLALHVLRIPPQEVEALARSILQVQQRVRRCAVCHVMTETDPCPVCTDQGRDQGLLMVVEDSEDVAAVERTGAYRGRYHVLGGVLSPLEGVGPQDLNLDSLRARLRTGGLREVILAVNPTLEGEATTLYLQRLLRDADLAVTRLARGIPVGGQLDQYDEVTLEKAITGRSPA